jgi:hypothetical protein
MAKGTITDPSHQTNFGGQCFLLRRLSDYAENLDVRGRAQDKGGQKRASECADSRKGTFMDTP